MKTSNTKRKIAETLWAPPSERPSLGLPAPWPEDWWEARSPRTHPRPAESKRAPKQTEQDADDPIIHAQLKRILVPLDFSSPSRRALRFAREWAARFGSEVCLLHVVEPTNTFGVLGIEPIGLPLPPVDFHGKLAPNSKSSSTRSFPTRRRCPCIFGTESPYDEIATAARELEADLIIIATHGRTGLVARLAGQHRRARRASRAVSRAHAAAGKARMNNRIASLRPRTG